MGNNSQLRWWERYLASVTADYRRVYVGVYVALAGGLFGVVSWLLYVWSFAAEATLWTVREAAFATGPLGLVLVLFGFVSLLTADQPVVPWYVRRTKWTGFAGCLGGLTVFLYAYPSAWNVPGTDYSLIGVSLFGAGLGLMFLAGFVAIHERRTSPRLR